MPLRAEMRRSAEWLLRAALVAALALALWRETHHVVISGSTRIAVANTVDREITRALATPATTTVDLLMDGGLSRAQRDALVALRRTGIAVQWHGAYPALALEVVREREPDARARVMLVGNERAEIALADSAGSLDVVRAGPGATINVGTLVGVVRATLGAYTAQTLASAGTRRGAVLVLSHAGWEGKFVMSALSEAGWVVRARIPVAPNVDVRDDGLLPLDTARYDAVVALDSSATEFAPAIARFVAQGGGLVAVGDAMSIDALRGIVPAQPGTRRPGRILLAEDTLTPADLPVRPLADLRHDALTLEKEAAGVTLAARRAGMGRVLAVGYDESWRWRMLGGTSGVVAHRAWWSRAVGSVAPEREGGAVVQNGDAAPRAALIDALGPPLATVPALSHATANNTLPLMLLTVIVLVLLAEIGSRRFRGAP